MLVTSEKGTRPQITWQHNAGHPAKPPADAQEWQGIVADAVGNSERVKVVLVSRGNGLWHLATAQRIEMAQPVGSGSIPIAPTDLRERVKAALKKAGKPVLD